MAKSPAPRKPAPKPAAQPAPAPAAPTLDVGALLPPWMRRFRQYRGLIVPVSFILMLGVLLVPLPPVLMDVLIALNISLGIIILMTTIYMDHP
ncbi:MAG: hypothetical protein JNL50_07880, partial [Phycisphaerae bacterium]|nr:hypothetical protein [Phycisphaerae bacterium]